MPTTTRAQRWERIHQTQSLISGGASNRDIVMALGKDGVSEKTAYRYIDRAYKAWNREARKRTCKRDYQLAQALAERGRVKRLALTRKRFVVVDKELQKLDDPDYAGYLAACDSEAKILGLFAPEQHEVHVAHLGVVARRFADMIVEMVKDAALRNAMLLRLETLHVAAAKEDVDESKVVDAALVVVKEDEVLIKQLPDKPSANGHANGKNGAAH